MKNFEIYGLASWSYDRDYYLINAQPDFYCLDV